MKRKHHFKRRYRRIHRAALALGQVETLLDLTPIDAKEIKAFLEAPLDERIKETMNALTKSLQGIGKGFQRQVGESDQALRDRIAKIIGNGVKGNPPKLPNSMPWQLHHYQYFVDECVNYPLTPFE